MRTFAQPPSAPFDTLLRAIEEANYHCTHSSGQYARYRNPVLQAARDHREMLAGYWVRPELIQFAKGDSPWEVLWIQIAPLIGQPKNLGQPTSDRISTRQFKKKLIRSADAQEEQ